jgi:hypothetical protein
MLLMANKSVYSIRLREDVRRMMDELADVNWQEEIRQTVERMVREKKKQQFLEQSREMRKRMKPIPVGAAQMIREDRDAR